MSSDLSSTKLSLLGRVARSIGALLVVGLLFFGSQIVGVQIIAAVMLLLGVSESEIAATIQGNQFISFAVLIFVQLLLVGGIIVFLRWRQLPVKKMLLLDRLPRLSDGGVAIIAFGWYFIALIAIINTVSLLLPALDVNQQQELGIADPNTAVQMLLVYITIVILPSVVEEVLFRGFLYQLLKRFGGVIVAYVLTSILFGMAHLEYDNLNWVAMLDTTIFSVFLIYISQRQQSLWPAILLHGIKNSLAYYYLFVR
jgi:membrane protease YdiL (CAAX protease family)